MHVVGATGPETLQKSNTGHVPHGTPVYDESIL